MIGDLAHVFNRGVEKRKIFLDEDDYIRFATNLIFLNNQEELVCKILKELKAPVLITRGEKGMTLFETNGKVMNIPTKAKEVYDVTGAGDTVVATVTLALTSGATLRQAAIIANHAAGVVVGKVGTSTLSINELKQSLENE